MPSSPGGLPLAAEELPAEFAARFNTGDARAVQELYEPGAVFVPPAGEPARTPAAIGRANAAFLGLGLPISVRPRDVHVTDDGLALLVVDWEIEGTGPDGEPVRVAATATDVARRGPDGRWRYVIDHPFGGVPAERRFDAGRPST
ncbi:YybH family protein [Streptomyces sp. NPDC018031]|uniref:YybH family protein n=1 Tax=Streptomyces sp. NPDC018031 TaxID=3365033 RepID=UPI0037B65A63